MLEIWTIQMAKWRNLPKDIELIDITAKSGNQAFAPDFHAVMKYKRGDLYEDQYTTLYRRKMACSYRTKTDEWRTLMGKGRIALACYCQAGVFCHRHLMTDILLEGCKALKIPVALRGEYGVKMKLFDEGVRDIDPFDPKLSEEMKLRILKEAKMNPVYYFNVVCQETRPVGRQEK